MSISPRTLATWLKHGLIQYSKVNGVVLLERAVLDEFLRGKRVEPEAEKIVREVLAR